MNRCPTGFLRTLLLATLITLFMLVSSAFAQHEQVYTFTGPNGANPIGGLIVDANGNFYGTVGGVTGFGAVFEISQVLNNPPVEAILYSFTGGADGAGPTGNLVFDSAGNLYGTAVEGGDTTNCTLGCGVVYELSPPGQPGGSWTETVLYSFQGGTSDGASPFYGVSFDQAGNLYGTIPGGSKLCPQTCGMVFEVSPPVVQGAPWTETGNQGDAYRTTTPVTFNGPTTLYGTTTGTVFRLSKSGNTWTETTLHTFSGKKDGSNPSGVTIYNGAVYGTTVVGGLQNDGVIFRVSR